MACQIRLRNDTIQGQSISGANLIVGRIGLTVFSIKAYSNHSEEGKARRESLDAHAPWTLRRVGAQNGNYYGRYLNTCVIMATSD